MATPVNLLVFANTDHAIITWRYPQPIPNCVGFAIFKKKAGQPNAMATPLDNRIPFAGEQYTPGEQRPCTEWPFQRFLWSDFSVMSGDKVQYVVFPVLINQAGSQLSVDEQNASAWSPVVTIGTGTTYQAYFNRGIVSSQFFARGLTEVQKQAGQKGATVKSVVSGPDSPLRSLMGGPLAQQLFALLDGIIADGRTEIYGALYELNQTDLITRLCKLGKRAHIILANGTGSASGSKSKTGDENAAARATIKKAGVDVHDRIVNASQHYAHNKFLCITDTVGKPLKVWTGSTNWTANGLFAQVNNGVLINNPAMAQVYYNEWQQIKAAGNNYPPNFSAFNKAAFGSGPSNATTSGASPRTWFAPTPAFADLADANKLINAAKTGVLFLIFNPGPKNTLFNTLQTLQTSNPNLFIHGVLNQDPGTGGNKLILFHKGASINANFDDVIAQNIKANTSFWTQEPKEMVTIHSKVVVVDPFGPNPVVMTGSHNMGPKASGKNDDNLNMLFDGALAKEFAANIMAVYDHYHWRYSVLNQASNFSGLEADPDWMTNYKVDPSETKFFGFGS